MHESYAVYICLLDKKNVFKKCHICTKIPLIVIVFIKLNIARMTLYCKYNII